MKDHLDRNLTSVEALQELLTTHFTAITDVSTIIPKNTFAFSNTMVFSSFADDAALKQAKSIEDDFGHTFNGSVWKFQGDHSQYSQGDFVVSTASGQNETANFACSGAQFRSGTLIKGMDFMASLYQSKNNPKNFILLFGVASGMIVAADFQQK